MVTRLIPIVLIKINENLINYIRIRPCIMYVFTFYYTAYKYIIKL